MTSRIGRRCTTGRWGVWRVRCAACGCDQVAVAPLSVRFPLECDCCGAMACEPGRRG